MNELASSKVSSLVTQAVLMKPASGVCCSLGVYAACFWALILLRSIYRLRNLSSSTHKNVPSSRPPSPMPIPMPALAPTLGPEETVTDGLTCCPVMETEGVDEAEAGDPESVDCCEVIATVIWCVIITVDSKLNPWPGEGDGGFDGRKDLTACIPVKTVEMKVRMRTTNANLGKLSKSRGIWSKANIQESIPAVRISSISSKIFPKVIRGGVTNEQF